MSKYFIIADTDYPLVQPPCRPVPELDQYEITQFCEWRFLVFEKEKPMRLLVFRFSPGDRWDGASIPRPVWSIIGGAFDPDYMLASLIHDRCCEITGLREIGDYIFVYLLRECGVGVIRRRAMFIGVRGYAVLTNKK